MRVFVRFSSQHHPMDQLAELSLFDANVGSLAELNDLPLMTGLRSLNLHANRQSQIGQHLERQTRLTTHIVSFFTFWLYVYPQGLCVWSLKRKARG